MFFGPELFMMLIMLVGQTGGDLLDLVSTDAYWRNKNVTVSIEQLRRDAGPDAPIANVDQLVKDLSDEEFPVRNKARQKLLDMGPAVIDKLKPVTSSTDSEVAATAQQIIKQLSTHAQARQIRRLMAIRTLGERKDKEAPEILKPLTDSKEPFVAGYARRALAQIEGKPYVPANDDKALAADLQALPKESSIVAQFRTGATGKNVTIDSLVDEVLKGAGDQANAAKIAGIMPQFKIPDRQKLVDRMTTELLKVLEAVGNIRVDSASVGVDVDAEGEKGFAAIVLRGQYNPQALLDFARTNATGEVSAHVKFRKVDGTDFIDLDREGSVALVSPQCIALVGGPPSEHHPDAVAELLKRLIPGAAAPKGGIAENDQLAPLLKSVDKHAAAWVCGITPKPLHDEKATSGFDTFIAQAFRDKDAVRFTVTGTGNDADKVKASTDALSDGIKETLAEVTQQAAQQKALKPVVDMFESLKCVAEGKSATLSGTFTTDIFTAFLQESGLIMMLGEMEDRPGPGGIVPGNAPDDN